MHPQIFGDVLLLTCGIQHIFDEDSVPGIGGVDQDMGHGPHQLSVLQNRAAGHECCQVGTTNFFYYFIFL